MFNCMITNIKELFIRFKLTILLTKSSKQSRDALDAYHRYRVNKEQCHIECKKLHEGLHYSRYKTERM